MLAFFGLTLFVSATLLFFVQPMIGKMLLPRLGGTPAVWNTCMVFFQAMLLVGYGYTHAISTTQPRRRQLLIQGVILFLPLLVLPFALPAGESGQPPTEESPIVWLLVILLGMVGLPFFVVSTTAPLLQRWFATTGHPAAKDPYFLYGASNLGSMIGLLAYPALIEWIWDVPAQTVIWTAGYGLFVVVVLGCAYLVWRTPEPLAALQLEPLAALQLEPLAALQPQPELVLAASTAVMPSRRRGSRFASAPPREAVPVAFKKPAAEPTSLLGRLSWTLLAKETPDAAPDADRITFARRLRWVLLAAAPSSLMLGVTTYLTTDIAAVPFFWVVPLALYLMTFILVFAKWPVVWTGTPHTVLLYLQPCFLLFLVLTMVVHLEFPYYPTLFNFAINLTAFFMTALVCHGELACDRPNPRHLTEFFLWMSVGGVLGGLFNAFIAPLALPYGIIEYPIAMVAACLLRPHMVQDVSQANSLTSFQGIAALPAALLDGVLLVLGMATVDTFRVRPEEEHGTAARLLGRLRRAWSSNLLEIVLDVAVPVAFFFFAYMMVYVGDHQKIYWGLTFKRSYMMAATVVLALAMAMRPVRFGLSVAAVFLAVTLYDRSYESLVFEDRGFFGLVRVRDDQHDHSVHRTLVHGGINHGQQIVWPEPLRRQPITYFHPTNGIGEVFHKLTWGNPPGKAGSSAHTAWMENYYWTDGPHQRKDETEEQFGTRYGEWFDGYVKLRAHFYPGDARMPASLVGLAAAGAPWPFIAGTQQQPPFGVIGLGAGTMAAHAQPCQHVDFFEIDPIVKRLSVPPSGSADDLIFHYVNDALKRSARLEIVMGDGRRRMTEAPERFYHAILIDAFSSDAVPVHLLTKEAVEIYFDKLVDGGVLLFNTTNRYVDLPPVLARIAEELNLECLHCPDYPDHRVSPEKFGADWLALRRRDKTPGVYSSGGPSLYHRLQITPERWHKVEPAAGRAWTDAYSNLLRALRL